MARVIRGVYRGGALELSEPLPVEEGAELTVVIPALSETSAFEDSIKSTAGAWADLLDCERFEEDVYSNRLSNSCMGVEF